ncbi:hypothetical protein LZ554_002946 [Drepanopeziza brunnea f. sp. 'monogermtubi']|nr:hypothetical protein LZ554_002946 [Drepanopeziza brunnea f. sp. 'monogermtubi']
MAALRCHLEQISLSAESIAGLRFPPPKIFTNALLSAPDITFLIRDTEPHERALFSVPSQPPHIRSSTPYQDPSTSTTSRRQTVFNVTQGEITAGTATGSRAPRRNTAVASVLGAELHSQVRKTEGNGKIDVEVLLRGAEKLNNVYNVPGVSGRIEELRRHYEDVTRELEHCEEKVERQTRELEMIIRGDTPGDENTDGHEGDEDRDEENEYGVEVTDEELMAEEEEIKELERKKKELEERISGMERDLGGLSR